MKKVSFSINSSKSNPSAQNRPATFDDPADGKSGDGNPISYVTEFVPDQTLNIAVIPPLKNEWDCQTLHLPISDGGAEPSLKRLRLDLDRLPEDGGLAEFEGRPVEGFGAALLAGYGWYEGRGIGKNAVEDVKVVEFTPRIGRAGLGFVIGGDEKMRGGIPKQQEEEEEDGIVGLKKCR